MGTSQPCDRPDRERNYQISFDLDQCDKPPRMVFEIKVTGVLEMHGSNKYTEHANLVDRVAYKVGVDFDKAVHLQVLSVSRL